jgi:hypothetical protein
VVLENHDPWIPFLLISTSSQNDGKREKPRRSYSGCIQSIINSYNSLSAQVKSNDCNGEKMSWRDMEWKMSPSLNEPFKMKDYNNFVLFDCSADDVKSRESNVPASHAVRYSLLFVLSPWIQCWLPLQYISGVQSFSFFSTFLFLISFFLYSIILEK